MMREETTKITVPVIPIADVHMNSCGGAYCQMTPTPTLTDDPHAVTCAICLRSMEHDLHN